MKVLPFPVSLSTVISPPIISTILLVMGMPSPAPWIPLLVAVDSRSKGSKICFTNSFDIPIPLSWTTNS